jgi:DNA damage-binding protein 1
MTTVKTRTAQAAFSSRDSALSRALHQSTELAEIAAGKSDFLHGTPPTASFTTSCLSSGLRGSIGAVLLASCLFAIPTENRVLFWILGSVTLSSLSYILSWVDGMMMSEFTDFERQRERWEVENFPEGEIQEMVQLYTGFGVTEGDAHLVAKTLSKYPEFWVEHMLLHEIGIVPTVQSSTQDETVWSDKVLPFIAFHGALALPLVLLCSVSEIRIMWSVALFQCLAFLEIKRRKSQWLSMSSTAMMALVLILATASLSELSRLIVHLS